MGRGLVCLLLLVLVLAPGCGGGSGGADDGAGGGDAGREAPAEPQLTARVANRLDDVLRQAVNYAEIPGASASVVFPDGTQWNGAAGYAVLEPELRMTSSTSLPFDSVTKVAVAALALRLAERGRLRLDDRIARWYPAWRGDDGATVRELLGHRAGVRDPAEAVLRRFDARMRRRPGLALAPAELIAAAPKPGSRTPGAEYSNVGYLIAGEVLQRAAGEPLAPVLRRWVLDHRGGDGLAYQPAERPHPPLAHVYGYPGEFGDRRDLSAAGPYIPSRATASAIGPAGSLAGDVPSLARWGHTLFTGGILSAASLAAMTAFRRSTFLNGYGLGLMRDSIEEHDMWGHIGDGAGSHTEFWHLPDERITLAISWNDGALDRPGAGGPLPNLVRGLSLEPEDAG